MTLPPSPSESCVHAITKTNVNFFDTLYWRNKNWPCLLRSLEKITCLSALAVQSDMLPIYETPFNALCHVPKIVQDIGLNENSFDINLISLYSNFLKPITEKRPAWYTFYTMHQNLIGIAMWALLFTMQPLKCGVFINYLLRQVFLVENAQLF